MAFSQSPSLCTQTNTRFQHSPLKWMNAWALKSRRIATVSRNNGKRIPKWSPNWGSNSILHFNWESNRNGTRGSKGKSQLVLSRLRLRLRPSYIGKIQHFVQYKSRESHAHKFLISLGWQTFRSGPEERERRRSCTSCDWKVSQLVAELEASLLLKQAVDKEPAVIFLILCSLIYKLNNNNNTVLLPRQLSSSLSLSLSLSGSHPSLPVWHQPRLEARIQLGPEANEKINFHIHHRLLHQLARKVNTTGCIHFDPTGARQHLAPSPSFSASKYSASTSLTWAEMFHFACKVFGQNIGENRWKKRSLESSNWTTTTKSLPFRGILSHKRDLYLHTFILDCYFVVLSLSLSFSRFPIACLSNTHWKYKPKSVDTLSFLLQVSKIFQKAFLNWKKLSWVELSSCE